MAAAATLLRPAQPQAYDSALPQPPCPCRCSPTVRAAQPVPDSDVDRLPCPVVTESSSDGIRWLKQQQPGGSHSQLLHLHLHQESGRNRERNRMAATAAAASVRPAMPQAGSDQKASLLCTPKHRVAAAGRRSLSFTARASLNSGAKVSIPKQWYNLIADLPVKPPPPLHPQTHQPLNPSDLSPLFPDELIRQEVTDERFIDIPEEVIDVYELWRPTPLIRARRLEKLLGTPAKIYYKYEGTSPAGSHKPNTAVPQAWYNAAAGVKNVVTETGAGQWGSALSFASSLFGLNCEVWQVRASFDQKPYRRLMMETWGAKVHASPSPATEAGRRILAADPASPGSLGIAISEAVEVAAGDAGTKYCLGSVLNHVLLHQTVIGEECLQQLAALGEAPPDVVVGCTGGGSNFGGLAFPFMREKLAGRMSPAFVAVEPAACPTLTKGVYAYDFGDTAGLTPLMKMHTLGHGFVPDPIHAGGLRYHGMAPLISHVYELGFMDAVSIQQTECFQAALQFARTEGIIPAPEPTHAIAAAIREAVECKRTGEEKVILMAMCGHGHFDLAAYDKYLRGDMVDLSHPADKLEASLAAVPKI